MDDIVYRTGDCRVKVDSEIEELIPEFVDNRHDDVRELEASLARNDLEAVDFVAHRIKGVGGSYGFHEISRLAAGMETAAQQGDRDLVAKYLAAMKDYLSRMVIEFE